ncbi:MAG: hypothetical protein K2X52_26645 [Mycobacteriaceae bacterium]|nr:hypothetical protein [Mycobacteriaceae bacterium]
MSAPTDSFTTAQARRPRIGYLRLRLKPAHRSGASVQGAWWPRTDQLFVELPPLLTTLAPRVGSVDRVIYDETSRAPQSMRMEFAARSIVLEGSRTTSTNTLSVTGSGGRVVLLVVPPYTDLARAYTAVMAASKPGDMSSPSKLLGIRPREARDRRRALMAQLRWESEGGVRRQPRDDVSEGVEVCERLEALSA